MLLPHMKWKFLHGLFFKSLGMEWGNDENIKEKKTIFFIWKTPANNNNNNNNNNNKKY